MWPGCRPPDPTSRSVSLTCLPPSGALASKASPSGKMSGRGFKDALQHMATVDPLHLLVGPEGGLAPDEVKMAGGLGFVTASLGRRTLRTETATVAAIGIIQYELGDLGKP